MAIKNIGVAVVAGMLLGISQGERVAAADRREPIASAAREVDGAEQAEIARWVRELGASTFMARQHAQRALVGMGIKARPALELATHDPDLEIQRRAKAALVAIHDVDFYLRLGEFLDDDNPDADHGLAGWTRYRSLVGTGAAARRLFADMQRAERELLESVDRFPDKSGTLLDARCQQAESANQTSANQTSANQTSDSARQAPLSLGTMAAIIFSASDSDVPVSAQAGNCINNFGNQTSLSQALYTRPTGTVIRSLLGAWTSRPFERESITGCRNLIMAMTYNLKEALPVAVRLIEPPGGPPHLEQYAVLAIGKLGGREHLAALEPLLKDERPVGVPDRSGRESDAQIRDVVLATMIHLAGQKLVDYGFVHAKSNSAILFNTNTLGFNDPTARAEALKKWREWSEKHFK